MKKDVIIGVSGKILIKRFSFKKNYKVIEIIRRIFKKKLLQFK